MRRTSANMQVMIELVINHTSDQHPWFQGGAPGASGLAGARNVCLVRHGPEIQGCAHHLHRYGKIQLDLGSETAKAYYWHRFFSHQPDLNYDNPLVLEEVLKAMRFWLDMGVDGFRMDAIPYLVERDGTNCENLPETHAVIKELRAAIDAEYANRADSGRGEPVARPTCGRISAMATNATWHFIFR